VNPLFSHGQAQIDHVCPRVCIIELFARSQAPFPRSNRFLMGGVEEDINISNTQHLSFNPSATNRFIYLNLLVSASLLALAFRLPLLNTKVGHCKCPQSNEGG